MYLGCISRGQSVLAVPFCGYRSIVSAIIVNSPLVKRCGIHCACSSCTPGLGLRQFCRFQSGPQGWHTQKRAQSKWGFPISLCVWLQLS